MESDERVELWPLDEERLEALLDAAVADADPYEVMPPVEGPEGWTPARRRAFLDFHRSRSLAPVPVEATYAIAVGGRVAGAARLLLHQGGDAVETGVWIGRSQRGRGVGAAVVGLLLAEAAKTGARRLVATTTVDNGAARRLLAGAGAELTEDGEGGVDAVVRLG
ncbi:GNAT family N-acetyltransferase [Streptosporangium sp. NPDC004379]|uniref:GNAT family N-acetyltransferase n=1 Tax=Streptosporangium sp. NPDC004379 TaxID=3366189 RepID=UPI003676360C